MNRTIANILGIVSIAAVCLIGWAALKVGQSIPDLSATISKVNSALDNANDTLALVNRPCASVDKSGHLLPDGPICELDQAIHDVRKIATASGKQVQQTSQLINATAANMNIVGQSVKDVSESLKGTADAATGTLSQAQTDLETANGSIEKIGPLLDSYKASGDSLNVILKDKAIKETAANLAGMTDSGNKMLADAQQKEHELLHPTKAKGFKAFLGGAVMWIHRLEPPIL